MARHPRSTSALLQKVNSQLRGERVPLKSKDEDELDTYLSSLTRKTQQSRSADYQHIGDVSLSSDDSAAGKEGRLGGAKLGAGSKFLKKKPAQTQPAPSHPKKSPRGSAVGGRGPDRGRQSPRRAPGSAPEQRPSPNRSWQPGVARDSRSAGASGRSSALNKAAALTQKISQRAATIARQPSYDEDLDESISISLANESQSHRSKSRTRSRPGSGKRSSSRHNSLSDSSFGARDGKKFLKKPAGSGQGQGQGSGPVLVGKQQQLQPEASKGQSQVNSRPSSPAKAGQKGLLRQSSNVFLTSEDESFGENVLGLSLSSSEPTTSPHIAKAQRQEAAAKGPPQSKAPQPQKGQGEGQPWMRSPSPMGSRRSPSPHLSRRSGNLFLRRSMSQDSDALESIASDVGEDIADAGYKLGASTEAFEGVNLLDIDSLEPVQSLTQKKSIFPKPGEATLVEKPKKKKRPSSSTRSSRADKPDLFASMGIHTVEELFAAGGADVEENIVSEASEIHTQKSGLFASRKHREDSESEIVSEVQSRGRQTPQRRVSYSQDFEDSITERIGVDSQRDISTVVDIKTQASGEDTDVEYSSDFDDESKLSGKETISHSTPRSVTRSRSRSRSRTLSPSSYTRSYTYSRSSYDSDSESEVTPRRDRRRVVVETRSVEIQTPAVQGLEFRWNMLHQGLAISGPSQGLGYVDPSPIATHVVSADALEAMTAYSPAVLALHETLRQQLEMTREFIETQKRLYKTFTDGIQPDYHYTTLQDTKEYIRKHRKPRLSFKEAYRMVCAEMDR